MILPDVVIRGKENSSFYLDWHHFDQVKKEIHQRIMQRKTYTVLFMIVIELCYSSKSERLLSPYLKLCGNHHLERISILASEMFADERAKSHFTFSLLPLDNARCTEAVFAAQTAVWIFIHCFSDTAYNKLIWCRGWNCIFLGDSNVILKTTMQ